MNAFRAIAFVFAAGLAAASGADPLREAEAEVRSSLGPSMRNAGVSFSGGTLTAVGSAAFSLEPSAQGPGTMAAGRLRIVRTVCLRRAELKALRQIMEALQKEMSSAECVCAKDGETAAEREARRIHSVFAKGCRIGWETFAVSEKSDASCYAAAVAVRWSPGIESQIRAALNGEAAPTEEGRRELIEHIEAMEEIDRPGSRVFVDSGGFPHLFGIGVADIDRPASRRRARILAEAMATKNLLLNLKGDAAFSRRAADLLSEVSSGARSSTVAEAAYEALADVDYKGSVPEGVAPVYERIVRGGEGRGDVLVVFSAYEPLPGAGAAGMSAVEASQEGGSVMIFNPITGKFEKEGQ